MEKLSERRCQACNKDTPRVTEAQLPEYLAQVQGFESDGKLISKLFKFKNFPETMLFVNGVASIAHREDHHPDLEVGYNKCKVSFTTHDVGGLSENDFICAAKVNALIG
ncbi:MAG: 4a-hydroxytetrahydrobiopterin dehydratase [Polyangiaceae bacterium]